MLVSALLSFGMPDPAFAARSGGRVGGRAPTMRSAPRSSGATRMNATRSAQP